MSKRKTHEQFMKDFMEKNSKANDIEVLGQYVTNKTKIKCKCKIDGHIWEVTPSDLLSGRGCPKCSGKMKKTHEQFIKELKEINNDIEVLGTYISSHTKIKCKCKIDGHIWEATPSNLLNLKQGCPICGEKSRREKRTKTHEEFIKELQEINPNIEVLGTYVKSDIKIKVKCKIDGYIWEVKPNDLLQGKGCLLCSGRMKLTHEEFVNRMKEINNDIEVLGKYVNTRTKIKCRCKIDEYEWEANPFDLLYGHGCSKCSNVYRRTHEEFIKELQEINNNIEVLGQYKNNNTKIKCKCKIDGYEWEVIPSSLLSGKGCPKCSGNIKLTHEEFVNRMKEINNDIEVLGTYVNNHTKIKVKCKKDGNIWEVVPNSLLNGIGCPKCNSSKGEKRISKYLENNEIDFIPQYTFEDCKCKNILPFDFYIPSLNILIEYDGEQHFRPIEYFGGIDGFIGTKIRDTIKTWYCKKNSIKLIRIPYYNFDNIEEILEKELTLYKECNII